MRQFDLFENPVSQMRGAVPFVIVLSSHLLGDLAEVVVAPLRRNTAGGVPGLEVPVVVEGEPLLISLSGLAGVRAAGHRARKGSLLPHEDAIRRGLGRLFTSF